MTANKLFKTTIAPFTPPVRQTLTRLRVLIKTTAKETPGVGKLDELLKWGQFSFLTQETGSGSTIRIDGLRNRPDACALYFHCPSGLVELFEEIYKGKFAFEGKRAIIFETGKDWPEEELRHCISLALTHHLRKTSLSRQQKQKNAKTPNHHRHRSRPG